MDTQYQILAMNKMGRLQSEERIRERLEELKADPISNGRAIEALRWVLREDESALPSQLTPEQRELADLKRAIEAAKLTITILRRDLYHERNQKYKLEQELAALRNATVRVWGP